MTAKKAAKPEQTIDVCFKAFGPAGSGKTVLVEQVFKPALLAKHPGLKLEQLDSDGHAWRVYGTL